jgi:hypothetical protein
VKIITVSDKDVLTDDTATQILIHDEKVDKVCGK